jgi:protein TonB
MQSAQATWSQLQSELDAQSGRWIKHYDQARTLATQAKEQSDKARGDAQIARARIDSQEIERKKVAAERSRIRATAVRVSGPVRPPHKIRDVAPVYPAMARSAHIDGTVQLEATVGQDGKVVDARVLQSVPMLDKAALDAVQQWQYEPATQNGKPIPVLLKVNVKFQP